jgi:hypothetical protein
VSYKKGFSDISWQELNEVDFNIQLLLGKVSGNHIMCRWIAMHSFPCSSIFANEVSGSALGM